MQARFLIIDNVFRKLDSTRDFLGLPKIEQVLHRERTELETKLDQSPIQIRQQQLKSQSVNKHHIVANH